MNRTTLLLILGPPRSGTTILSDWIMETHGAYCAHEIMSIMDEDITQNEILEMLEKCSKNGSDRLDKKKLRSFMNWDVIHTEEQVSVLGWKEPIIGQAPDQLTDTEWTDLLDNILVRFIKAFSPKIIITQRHPVDIIASGQMRAKNTTNWPNYTTRDLCDFWARSVALRKALETKGIPVLSLRWEELALSPDTQAERLSSFIAHPIQPSSGRERSEEYLKSMRKGVSLEKGWERNPARKSVDKSQIAAYLKDAIGKEGYIL